VLLNEESSLFSAEGFVSGPDTTLNVWRSNVEKAVSRLIPSINNNIKARQNYDRFASLLLSQSTSPIVLVVGGSVLGKGVESLVQNHSLELIETDVSFGPRTVLICDAHDIPFENASFDGVVVQAVLEHVIDPYMCVEEIYRVLKSHGLVYAETAFMQQVHMGRYDFTRFTHLGHRRLFRRFEEIDSGAVCGPGMALAWSYQYFLLSFTNLRILRALLRIFAGLTSFYIQYFDYHLVDKAGALDAAAGYYFMGRKGSRTLTDRELMTLYRGAIQSDLSSTGMV